MPLILHNQHLQLQAAAAPRLGAGWVLHVRSRPGASTMPQLAAQFLGIAPTRLPLPPLGTLRVDPAMALLLPPALLPAPWGEATLTVPIPANAALQGVPLLAQCVVAGQATASLTNFLAERLR